MPSRRTSQTGPEAEGAGAQRPPVPVTLKSLADLHTQEVPILKAIAETRGGAELFLADPVRFLREHGFPLAPEAETELRRALPAVQRSPVALYDPIAAGNASLGSSATVRARYHIRSLGVATREGGR